VSLIDNLLALINWNVRRTHNHGGDDSASDDSERDPPEFGLEFIAERADDHEQRELTDPLQDINVYPSVFSDGIVFSNGEKGGWISAEVGSYIDWEEL
jgi:hypothetical protein